MPPEVLSPHQREQMAASTIPAAWRESLVGLAIAWFALFLCFAQDWGAMAYQWWNISTYTHVLLIPPIIGWLVWQRWPQLRGIEPSGWKPGLAIFALVLFGWVLGAFAGVDLVRQAAAVALLVVATLTVLGPKVGRALAFPLFYLTFLVPFGDELVPPLQLVTAKITVALVHASGIPAVIDGVFINTPAGLFEVAEACSGVKFLVAMVAFGVLASHVCFLSWRRRAAFMVLSVVAPILANGVRAWGTIYVAQFKGADYAGGVDHIIYGWVFFAVVIVAVLAISWRFFDRKPDDPLIDLAAIETSPLLARLAGMKIAVRPALSAMGAIVLVGTAWALLADRLRAEVPPQIFLPEVPGWTRVNYEPEVWWEPRASGADHRLLGRYADGKGHEVDVFFALYSSQSDGREAGGFGEGALTPDTGWAWLAPGPAVPDAMSDRLLTAATLERVAETRYRTGDLLTGRNFELKLANMRDRLLLRARPTMLLILSSEKRGDAPPEESIATFRRAAGPMAPWMDRLASGKAR